MKLSTHHVMLLSTINFLKFATVISGTLLLASCSTSDEGNPVSSISGAVTETGGAPVAGVSIYVNDELLGETSTSGSYIITDLAPGTYTVRPEEDNRTFEPAERTITLTESGLSDIDFERIATDQITHNGAVWALFNNSVYAVKTNDASTLQLDLIENALWYNESIGGGVYQEVSGNFTLTATVNAVKKLDNSQPVTCEVCLGGLMVRNPDEETGQNYVHLVTGNTPNGQGYETKNTINSVSTYDAYGNGLTKHDLKIQRTGSTFTLFKKAAEDTDWVLVATYERTDMPGTVQVGLNIYTAKTGTVADLSVIYENITVETN